MFALAFNHIQRYYDFLSRIRRKHRAAARRFVEIHQGASTGNLNLAQDSALNLNRTLAETWDENMIQTRSEELLKLAISVWPRPQADRLTNYEASH
jgi:hypothetical protein